jgi:hypothetical protein
MTKLDFGNNLFLGYEQNCLLTKHEIKLFIIPVNTSSDNKTSN